MKKFHTLLLIAFSLFATAQIPQLVNDFSPGSVDSDHNDGAIAVGDGFIFFPVSSTDYYDEPCVIKDGEISFLRDFESLPPNSSVSAYISFNGKVYFTSSNNTVGLSIYETDGTVEGTVIIGTIDPAQDGYFGRLLVTAKNELYFTYDQKLYTIIDSAVEFVIDDVNFEFEIFYGEVVCTYNDYFAFMRESSFNEIEIVAYNGTDLEVLATVPFNSFGSFKYGIAQVKEGLVLALDEGSSSPNTGYFRYNENTGEVTKIFEDEDMPIYTYNLNNELQINHSAGLGWTTSDATSDNIIDNLNVFEGPGTSNHDVNIVYKDKFFFLGEAIFEDYYHITDGTPENTKSLFEFDFGNPTDALGYNDYVFVGLTSNNNTNSYIYYVDILEEEANTLINIPGSQNLSLIGVLDEKLYFFVTIDPEIGNELYYIDLDLPNITATKEEKSIVDYDVTFNQNTVTLNANLSSDFSLTIYNTAGQKLHGYKGKTNEAIHFDKIPGLMLFSFEINGEIFTEKYIGR